MSLRLAQRQYVQRTRRTQTPAKSAAGAAAALPRSLQQRDFAPRARAPAPDDHHSGRSRPFPVKERAARVRGARWQAMRSLRSRSELDAAPAQRMAAPDAAPGTLSRAAAAGAGNDGLQRARGLPNVGKAPASLQTGVSRPVIRQTTGAASPLALLSCPVPRPAAAAPLRSNRAARPCSLRAGGSVKGFTEPRGCTAWSLPPLTTLNVAGSWPLGSPPSCRAQRKPSSRRSCLQ